MRQDQQLSDKLLISTAWPESQVVVEAVQLALDAYGKEYTDLVYKISATVGQTIVEQAHTVSTASPIGAAALQVLVDGFRQTVADIAATRESARIAAAQIV